MRNNINRELNDIAKDIQTSQAKANEIYNAIGRAYYAKAKGNPNEKAFHPWTYDVHYDESVLVGYRWYETKGIEPLYPFGHGLSYTTFELSKAKAAKQISADKPLKVTVKLANTGKMAGAEVVQLYVSENNPTVLRPKKELKAFKKVHLEPGKSTTVTFELKHSDLAFWNDKTHAWDVNKGSYTIHIGNSSANIAQTLTVEAL